MQAHAITEEPNTPDILAVGAEELAERMLEPATMQAIYEDTNAIIRGNRTPENLFSLVRNAVATMEQVWSGLSEEGPAYDCKKGCSWCCHQSVMVTAPEVLAIADFLRDNLTEGVTARLAALVGERAAETDGLSNDDRMDRRIPCVFLMDDACTIYPVRPLQCRGGYSEDEEYCRDLLDDREATQQAVAEGSRDGRYLLVPKMLYDSAQVGMAAALKAEGLNADPLDLTAAMAIALADPDVTEKWLSGWPVFAPARLHKKPAKAGGHYVTQMETAV